MFALQPEGAKDHGRCAHCGNLSRVVWGTVYREGESRGVYYVHWTLGPSEHPANFDLILGEWGDDVPPTARFCVSLLYFQNDAGEPSFMVIDAKGRPHDTPDMAGRALPRAEVIGTPLAQEVFEIVDCILLRDDRIGPIEFSPPEAMPRPRLPAPETCPVCGQDVPRNALACPECGADHESGWKENAEGLDVSGSAHEEDFDYDAFTKEEFGHSPVPKGLHPVWWGMAIILLAIFVLAYLLRVA